MADALISSRARAVLETLADPEALAIRAVLEAFAAEPPGTRGGVREALSQEVRAEAAALGVACAPESPRKRGWPRPRSAELALHNAAANALGTFRDAHNTDYNFESYLPGDPLERRSWFENLEGVAMSVVRRHAAALSPSPMPPKSADFGA